MSKWVYSKKYIIAQQQPQPEDYRQELLAQMSEFFNEHQLGEYFSEDDFHKCFDKNKNSGGRKKIRENTFNCIERELRLKYGDKIVEEFNKALNQIRSELLRDLTSDLPVRQR